MNLSSKKSVEELSEALMLRWPGTDTLYDLGGDERVQEVESYVHELAHAAIFAIDPLDLDDDDLTGEVAKEFARYEKPESDRKEIEGIVVSFMVFDKTKLKIPDRARRKIVTNAIQNFEEKWWKPPMVWALIDYLSPNAVLKGEADKVIGWLEQVLEAHRER